MLLGIVLHAALAFVPDAPWMVKDTQSDPGMGSVLGAIHGFRMPLFFLISGYFTAMLWRRRGLGALAWHRFRRIALPLFLGLVTIVPAMDAAGRFAKRREIADAQRWETDRSSDAGSLDGVYEAARLGRLERIERAIAQSADLNQAGGRFGATPLSLAAWGGRVQVIDALLDAGVDPNRPNTDGHVALHGAAFFGRPGAVKRLLDGGADPEFKNREGKRAQDVIWTDLGTTEYLAGVVEIEIDRKQLVEQRVTAMKLLGGDGQSLRKVLSAQLASGDGADAKGNDAAEKWVRDFVVGGLYRPFYAHLWFLHFLIWLVMGFVIYCGLMNLFGIKTLPRMLVARPCCYLYLIPITFLAQRWMTPGGGSFGPNTSSGWIPMPSVLAYYAIFFFYGAMVFDTPPRDRSRAVRLVGGLVGSIIAVAILFPLGNHAMDQTLSRMGWADDGVARLRLLAMVTYAWVASFAMLDLFSAVLRRESPAVRWISDSSYWLYLVHLPLLLVIQAYLRPWQASPWLKLIVVCGIATTLLLISYRYGVRYTPIGTLLNGRRRSRDVPAVSTTAEQV